MSLNKCYSVVLQAAVDPAAVSVIQSQQPTAEERAHGTISMKTYYQYLTTDRGHLLTLIVIVLFILGEVSHIILFLSSQFLYSVHNFYPFPVGICYYR